MHPMPVFSDNSHIQTAQKPLEQLIFHTDKHIDINMVDIFTACAIYPLPCKRRNIQLHPVHRNSTDTGTPDTPHQPSSIIQNTAAIRNNKIPYHTAVIHTYYPSRPSTPEYVSLFTTPRGNKLVLYRLLHICGIRFDKIILTMLQRILPNAAANAPLDKINDRQCDNAYGIDIIQRIFEYQ